MSVTSVSHHSRASILALAVLGAACTGNLSGGPDDSSSPAAGRSGATGNGGSAGVGGGTAPPGTFVPQAASLRRLSVAQYRNTLRDLFGDISLPEDLEPDTLLHGSSSIGAARVAMSPRATEQFEAAALAVSKQAFADAASRAVLTGCDPAADAGCTSSFLARFGREVWRRPLASEELDRYAGLAATAAQALGSAWSGLEYAVAGLLQSPNFLYRTELGAPDPADAARRALGGYELASRLSYFLWNSTPDRELLDAAERGDLDTEAGLAAQAERLLSAPRASESLQSLFGELFRLDKLEDMVQQPDAFPQVTPTLGPALREETLRFFADLVERDASYRSIFETRRTFVNAELAALYGVPAPAGGGFAAVTLPEGPRAGILGQGGFLANNAHAASTSPTLRGKFIREVLLCQAIPPPPPNAVTDLDLAVGDEPRTMREKLAVHAEQEACASCHAVMDPIGLALENFDGVGAFRTTDVGKPIDASGELDGVAFADALGLGAALARHPAITECLARSVYRAAVGHLENAGEEPLVVELGRQAESDGARVRTLLLGVVRSAGFRYVATSE